MSYVAFFDVDHTLLNLNSGEAILRRAYKEGQLSRSRFIQAFLLAILYKIKLVSPYTIMQKFAGWMAGSKRSAFEIFCRHLAGDVLLPSLRPEIIREIEVHRKQGASLVILSSTIRSVCEPIADHFGMHAILSSDLEVVDGIYTGKAARSFCFRDEKLRCMRQYLQETGHSAESAFFYGDSTDDLPALREVGNPICVFPGRRLRKHARKNGWKIIGSEKS